MSNKFIILTTINSPTQAVKEIAEKCDEWKLIVVGDKKTPPDWKWDNTHYLSYNDQIILNSKLSKIAPANHYARKNIGYIYAICGGASIIAETDDDNLPYESYLGDINKLVSGSRVTRLGWENVYTHFSNERIWPRGFPLEFINESFYQKSKLELINNCNCPIQQFLANDNPDVDAVFRLTNPSSIKFDSNTIVLSEGTYCPFNSQNTIWWPEVFTYLYLPFTVSFRMTDIWRSFIAQRCLYAHGFNLAFKEASMYQIRNEHSLIKDFADEIPGYLQNIEIVDILESLCLSNDLKRASENLVMCYEALIEKNIINKNEMDYLQCWIEDISV